MPQLWKLPHIIKGTLTYVPPLNAWRIRRGSTGGTDSPHYCFSMWHRHLGALSKVGFNPHGTRMAELGPGDTIGLGLAALLSGVGQFIGLDLVPYAQGSDPVQIFDELCRIAADAEDPSRRLALSQSEIQRLRTDLQRGINNTETIRYQAPWSVSSIRKESLDLVLSMGVLQSVDQLEETYETMFEWLRPGGFASHWIAFSACHLSPYWNGHWAYSELEWNLVRGKREFLLNREPLSTHLRISKSTGFEILSMTPMAGVDGLPQEALAAGFRNLDPLDSRTCGAQVVLRKPA